MALCMGAEAACHLGDRELAATTYERLVDLRRPPGVRRAPARSSGRSTCSWRWPRTPPARPTSPPGTPTGAVELCEQWDVPLAADWVRRERERFGF